MNEHLFHYERALTREKEIKFSKLIEPTRRI